MIFRVRANDLNLAKIFVNGRMRSKVVGYKFGINEKRLNDYLLKHYSLSLKQMCLIILSRASVSKGTDCVVVTFPDKNIDDLATLITYGNSEVRGSDILNYALMRNK